MGAALVGRVDEAEAVDEPAGDGAVGDLVGGVPAAGVAHGGQAEAVLLVAPAVAQDAVPLAEVVAAHPRPVAV